MTSLFSKFFKKSNTPISSETPILKESYNVMKNIKLETAQKYSDTAKFKLMQDAVYEDLTDEEDTKYRMTVSYELESEDDQYPLEDILDKFLIHVSDFFESENKPNSNSYKGELAGELNDLLKAQVIIGKKVYNQDFLDDDKMVRLD